LKTRSDTTGNGIDETQLIVSGVSTTIIPGSGRSLASARRDAVLEKLRYAWLRRARLLRFFIWGAVISLIVAFLIPNRYKVMTRLMPPDQSNNAGMAMLAMLSGKAGGAGGGGAGAIASDLLGLKSPGALFIGVLQSATVADRLIDQFQLKKVYGTKYDEDTRKALAAHTEVNEEKRSGIISIEVTDRNAQRAAAMAAAYVDQLNLLVVQLNTSAAHRERVFLENRLQAVNTDLERNEKEFGDFASKNSALDVREEGKAMLDAVASLEGQLIAYQSELQGLRQIYSDGNVRVRSVQARITEIEKRIGDMNAGAKNPGAAPNDQSAGANSPSPDPNSDAQRDTVFPSIRKLPLLGVTYADLYRRTKVQEAVFEVLTQQYELAKVQEAKETPSVRVLDPAKVPDHKAFPSRLAVLLIGTFCSVLVGLFWDASRERWEALDEADSRKVFAREVWHDMRIDWDQVRNRRSGNGTNAAVEVKHEDPDWPNRNGGDSNNGQGK
jgi:uncharacterized protein involved in exopolysaccharide biosynthesis